MPAIVRSIRLAMYAAQAMGCTYGVLQYRRRDNCMQLWGW